MLRHADGCFALFGFFFFSEQKRLAKQAQKDKERAEKDAAKATQNGADGQAKKVISLF